MFNTIEVLGIIYFNSCSSNASGKSSTPLPEPKVGNPHTSTDKRIWSYDK